MVLCPYRLFSKQTEHVPVRYRCIFSLSSLKDFFGWLASKRLVSVYMCQLWSRRYNILCPSLSWDRIVLSFFSHFLFFGKESWFHITSFGVWWVCSCSLFFALKLSPTAHLRVNGFDCPFELFLWYLFSLLLINGTVRTVILSSDDRKLYQLPYFGNAIAIIVLPLWQIKPNILVWILIWYYLEIVLILLLL